MGPASAILATLVAAVLGAGRAGAATGSTVSTVLSSLEERLRASVVEVIAFRPMGPSLRSVQGERRFQRIEPFRGTIWATGVVIDRSGRILTCAEAAQPGDSLQLRLPDDRIVGARFLAQDAASGISLIEAEDASGLVPPPMPDSDLARSGLRIVVVHHTPERMAADVSFGVLTQEPTSGVGRFDLSLPDCVGTCGGVAVDCDGVFRGMVVDVAAIREADVGCSRFAAAIDRMRCGEVPVLPPEALRSLAASLLEQSRAPVGFLGVRAESAAPGDGGQPRPGAAGDLLSVVRVLPGSPAEIAGLMPGDQLLAIQGETVRDFAQVTERIAGTRPGTEIEIRVLRQGVAVTVRAQVGDRSSLDWLEREDQRALVREKELRQYLRELQGRLSEMEDRRARRR